MAALVSSLAALDRPPAVAGAFYPGSPAEIEAALDQLFADAGPSIPAVATDARWVGLVVPHAGWQFSGALVARGYRAVAGQRFDRIIMLGVDHRSPHDTVSVWATGSFLLPGGGIPIDSEVAAQLLDPALGFVDQPDQHRAEHSLEVLLPFHRRVFGSLPVVPISVGGRPANGRALGRLLVERLRTWPGRTLLVASTDWSHYHPAAEAGQMDQKARDLVLARDIDGLIVGCGMRQIELCGINGVIALLEVARADDAPGVVLAHADSSAASGDASQVVGYATILFAGKPTNAGGAPPSGARPAGPAAGPDAPPGRNASTATNTAQVTPTTDKEARMTPFQQEAMQAVRDTISAVLAGKPVPKFEFKDPRFAEHSGVFVTLKLHGDLRGCIGLIEGIKPLGQALPEMAAAAAFQDPRFRPLSAAEWPECKLDISVLTPLSRVASISELEVGKHGLLLRHQGRSGVLLPQVPVEQGWDLDTFLEQLCYKAGLPPGSHLHGHLYKFSAEVFGDAEH